MTSEIKEGEYTGLRIIAKMKKTEDGKWYSWSIFNGDEHFLSDSKAIDSSKLTDLNQTFNDAIKNIDTLIRLQYAREAYKRWTEEYPEEYKRVMDIQLAWQKEIGRRARNSN